MIRLVSLAFALFLAAVAPSLAQVCTDDAPPPPAQGDKPST